MSLPSSPESADLDSPISLSGRKRLDSEDFRAASDASGDEAQDKDAKEAAALHAAYMERKKKAKENRARRAAAKQAGSALHTKGFLSNLPEVNANIAYRFTITVVGDAAEQIVTAVCSAELAAKMNIPGTNYGVDSPEAYRCHAPVPYPPTAVPSHIDGLPNPERFTSDVPKLARLLFTPASLRSNIPVYRTRFEALSSALVYIFVINPGRQDHDFHRQVLAYERAVSELHFRSKPLRPARAVILCRRPEEQAESTAASSSSAAAPEARSDQRSWEAQLSDLEMVEDNLWKFGPIDLSDVDTLHATFATIASKRILRGERSGGDESDGSQDSDAPPQYDAEVDPNRNYEEMEAWMMTQLGDPYSYEAPDDDDPGSGGEGDLTSPKRKERFKHDWLSPLEKGAA
mmetsp:Transcript_58942/g.140706  ORF Transcript_58942/g.140706 Transcript_58942/m.140706 type:complete len:403 (+) Transcript_58942:152-1360(+)|eukprot:CAMPEP_0178432332 /NCGR_PEP_ID=MMETSP0689_2-20121128/32326_1 /TAXON_ID=160604 /ORGANISM="Amphidinium massartii, Strain CS-259" /LENGTH=402 /DNA_ID=CAMNT_0020054307 /DNA_START=69 /DNA_END=1277 /DNA_ORIENTATION=-